MYAKYLYCKCVYVLCACVCVNGINTAPLAVKGIKCSYWKIQCGHHAGVLCECSAIICYD